MNSTVRIDELTAESVAEAIIMALVTVKDVDPFEISPLGDYINPMAFNLLLEDDTFTGDITFQYEMYEITVTSDGTIVVT